MTKREKQRGLLVKWQSILLVLIIVVIVIINFRPGLFVLTNDNYSPELKPSLTISRILSSPAWRGYRALGVASDSEQSDFFRAVVFNMLDTILPKWSLGQFYLFVCLAVGVLSFAELLRRVVKDRLPDLNSNSAFVYGGLFYLTTLWTAWVFVFPLMPYITQFAFLPLCFLAIYCFSQTRTTSNALLVFVSSILLASSGLIATVFIVEAGLVLSFIMWTSFDLRNISKSLLRMIIVTVLFVGSQLFWILPFVSYAFNSSSDVMDSYVNRSITSTTIEQERQKMTASNSVRYYTLLLDMYDSNENEDKMFTAADDYKDIELLKVLSYVPLFFSVFGLGVIVFKRKFSMLYFWIGAMFIWFMLKNHNPPLGWIYTWFSDNFVVFRQIFRWPTSKLGGSLLVVFASTSALGVVLFERFSLSVIGGQVKKTVQIIIMVVVFFTQLTYTLYLFNGELIADRSFADLPFEYFGLSEYLEKENPAGRLIVIPPPNAGYFREHSWGFIGSGFLHYIIPNPVLDLGLSIGSSVSEEAVREMESSYFSDKDDFVAGLQKYDVKYVLLDRSFIEGRYGYNIDWERAGEVVSGLKSLWKDGDLVLYEVPDSFNINEYIEIYPETRGVSLQEGCFWSNKPQNPEIYPMLLKSDDSILNNNELSRSLTFDGFSGKYHIATESYGYSSPTTVSLHDSGSRIDLYPAWPTVNGVYPMVTRRSHIIDGNAEVLVVEDHVLSIDDLDEPYTISQEFASAQQKVRVSYAAWRSTSLKDSLSKAEVQNCRDGSSEDDVTMGFSDGILTLSSESGIGCLSSGIEVEKWPAAIKVDLSWYADEGTIVGYCIGLSEREFCLNDDRYYFSDGGENTLSEVIPYLVDYGEDVSFILYVVAADGKENSADFNRIDVMQMDGFSVLQGYGSSSIGQSDVHLEQGEKLNIEIPIVHGSSSYDYSEGGGKIWEPFYDLSGAYGDSVSFVSTDSNGMKQKALDSRVSLFTTVLSESVDDYLMFYWKGENINAVPGHLCLTYLNDDKCWMEDLFYAGQEKSILSFAGVTPGGEDMTATYSTYGYATTSENILKEFVVQEIPEEWSDLRLVPYNVHELEMNEPDFDTDSFKESFFVFDIDKSVGKIITIPYSVSNGWGAYVVNNYGFVEGLPLPLRSLGVMVLGEKMDDDQGVTVDGWKQGWIVPDGLADDSNDDGSKIVVLYTPNVTSYVGMFLSLVLFGGLIVIWGFMWIKRLLKSRKTLVVGLPKRDNVTFINHK